MRPDSYNFCAIFPLSFLTGNPNSFCADCCNEEVMKGFFGYDLRLLIFFLR